MDQPIIVTGHSHRNALGVPRDNSDEAHDLRPLAPVDSRFEAIAGRPTDEYWARLCAVAPGRRIAIVWDGNQYNGHYLLQPEVPFDVVVAELEHVPLIEGWPVVPELAIREKFAASAGRLREILESLSHQNPRCLALVSGPPPKMCERRLRPLLRLEAYFSEHARALGLDLSKIPITPASVRLKLWHTEQNCLRAVARQFGVRYIGVPPGGIDEIGYLKDEYWEHDATHANNKYGMLLRDWIAEHMA